MSDEVKLVLRWVGYAVTALVSWLGLAHPDVLAQIWTSIMGTRG